MYILKIAVGLGVLSIGSAGTYMTYDYLSKKESETTDGQNAEGALQKEAQSPQGVATPTEPGNPGTTINNVIAS